MLISFQNLDLLSVGLSTSAIGILGFIIYFNDQAKLLSKVFLTMCLMAIFWSLLNYFSYQFQAPVTVLWLLRFAVFFAVWFSYNIFLLFYYFPTENLKQKNLNLLLMLPLAILTSALCLTPLVFQSVTAFSTNGRVSQVENGPGIILFGATTTILIVIGSLLLITKARRADQETKKQIWFMLAGIILTSLLLIVFNYVFPALLNNPRFVPLGAVFLFPFVALTAYAIFKHHLFEVKIIATEILTFLLSIGLLFDVIQATSLAGSIFRFIIFILVLIAGILLIKSVRREVQQRQELEMLTKKLEQANDKLKVLDQARAEFISIASHQLRTPPATIKWYLSALLAGDYGPVPDELKEIIRKTKQTDDHLISLIEDMLNVSRIERGKMEFLFEPCNIQELAQAAYEQLLPIAHDKQLVLKFNPPARPLPEVVADKEKLRQVMNNLIDNALKYTKAGSVVVKLYCDDQNIYFSVTDTGKGVSIEDKNNIFQKYTRGKESVKQSAGLGLGLYVAKIIIEQHKGKIWADSQGEGLGSTFSFSIPIQSGLKRTTLVDLTQTQK